MYHVERCTCLIGESVFQVTGPGGFITQFTTFRGADACREALDRECARWASDCLDRIAAASAGGEKAGGRG